VSQTSRSAHFVSIALRASNVLRLGFATAALHHHPAKHAAVSGYARWQSDRLINLAFGGWQPKLLDHFSIMHMNYFSGFLALTPPPSGAAGAPAQGSPLGGLLVPMVLIFVVMYFVMIRPQSQRAKQQKKMLETLKSGDKVATAAGIIGVVITVKDTTVSIRSADAKMEVTKDSITQILESANSTPSAS
jgi:preprotein translocase subunit YajC